MSRSKSSRSGSADIGQKNNFSSVVSRTLSASKLCRGDALGSQIDANALKSTEKKPLKVSNSSENRIDRARVMMQQQIGELQEELKRTKEKLSVCEFERDQAMEEAHEAMMKANEAMSPKKTKELTMQLESLKVLLAGSRDELKTKNKKIESLEMELVRTREFEPSLREKEASLRELSKELRDLKEKERGMMELISENKRRVQELEAQLEKEKESEFRMVGSFAIQTKQLEAAKIELEESKIEITSLCDKIMLLEKSCKEISSSRDNEKSREEEIRELKFELRTTKENLAQVQEAEKQASLKAKTLSDEMELLKNELKQAIDADEKSNKAMDDLAMALKEVATESNQAKEKVNATQNELDHVKAEAEKLKAMVRSMEERYQKLLNEAKQEAELHKNTSDRLRLEAEETLFAWNGKEMGFVSCIKRAEEERAIAQHEKLKLAEALKAAENSTRASREETYKLRDIVKQALNEANAAKAAAGIAREENSALKDCLAEKEEALHFLARENERLRISEAAADENVKQLKRMLSTASSEFKNEDEGTRNGVLSKNKEDRNKKVKRAFSFDLEDLKFMNEPDNTNDNVLNEDPVKAEALKGSIFDDNAETPKSEPHTPKSVSSHKRGSSSPFTDCVGTPNSRDTEHNDGSDSDSERHSSRKMRTMFRRVGDLLMIRKGFHIH